MEGIIDGHHFRMDGGLLEIKLAGVWEIVKTVTQEQFTKLRDGDFAVPAWLILKEAL